MTPTDAYLMTDLGPECRLYRSSSGPTFDGISTDLPTQIAAAIRQRHAHTRERAEWDGWGASEEFEWVSAPDIYRLPVNTMVKARSLRPIYGTRLVNGCRVWGPLDQPPAPSALEAEATRRAYRLHHLDADDPMKDVIADEARSLPQPPRHAPTVFLASRYTLTRREIGIFTSYEQAVDAAPKLASIFAVPADGATGWLDAKLVRGRFGTTWGFASGYAETGTVGAMAAQR